MFDFGKVKAPYPGLRPFEAHESAIFFGREGHTGRLLEILQREHFLSVIGPSGCGKSSLVRAGLLPGLATGALGCGSEWRIAILRPGTNPLLALAQALLTRHALGRELLGEENLPQEEKEVTAHAALVAAELRLGAEGLTRRVQIAIKRQPEGATPLNLLLLVDQFEEIFTYADTPDADADDTKAFVDLLLAASKDAASRVYVTLTMRSDCLGHCVRFLELPEAINRAQFLIPRLSHEEMRRAICEPARVFGGKVADALADELTLNVDHNSDQLPILQHALARMWQVAERKNPEAPLLDADCAGEVGGVAEALNRHANEVLASLNPAQQALVESLFQAITARRDNGQEVRCPQTLAAIAAWIGVAAEELKPAISAFAAPDVSFLHHGRELTENSVVDLTHEALIRQWRQLRNWVADEYLRGEGYRRWSQRAFEWKNNGNLLGGAELARAFAWWNPTEDSAAWQPSPHWAARYSSASGEALDEEIRHTRDFLLKSREEEQSQQTNAREQKEAEAATALQRDDQEKIANASKWRLENSLRF